MINIAVISVARSDYSIIKPVLNLLKEDQNFDLRFYVSGMHLIKKYGNTINDIKHDNLKITKTINTNYISDNELAISNSISLGIKEYAKVFDKNKPDILLVTGDRFEVLAAVLAAVPYNILIAHIHGGELSLGAFDDSIRHSITKFSHMHFTTTDDYTRRIKQLGEEHFRIKTVGAPALDNLKNIKFKTLSQLSNEYNISLKNKPIILTYHPTTRHPNTIQSEMKNLIMAIKNVSHPIIFTAPNADTNNNVIIKMIKKFCLNNINANYIENLGTTNYYSFLKSSILMIGNSSSGIIEGASFKLPVINIGDRQLGRSTGPNVIHCKNSIYSIQKALNLALSDKFKDSIKGNKNMYYKNGASKKIVKYLKLMIRNKKINFKSFEDIY